MQTPRVELVNVPLWLYHPKRKHVLLVTHFEAELGFKLVRFGGRSRAEKHSVVVGNRCEGDGFNLARAIDGHCRLQPLNMTVDGEAHPFAIRRVDDLQQPIGKRAIYLERLRAVVMPAFMSSGYGLAGGRIRAVNAHVGHREGRNVREQLLLELPAKPISFGHG